jgi:hypothetical protein
MTQWQGIEPAQSRHFRENLEANLRLAERLAPIHCRECNGYHLKRARRRVQGPTPEALDRPDIIRLLRAWAADHSPGEGPLGVLIAGSGDTNLLATCAEALAGGDVRYTILDRCQTPLALCAAFARQHGLDVQIRQMDMAAPRETFAADIVIVHSLLRFLPRETHLATMVALRSWLRPEGAILFSHRLIGPDAGADSTGYRTEYEAAEPLRGLFADAGLQVAALEQHFEDPAGVENRPPRRRVLALLCARSG